ncbi:MAG: hypothetical protein A2284_16360 [Deltaproteobacteria bacterium RIFOXYA12_FULL_61_11]|nr:MAG: hypothetical protein A2284_16360 [Deltaproteobacteria bacterium RIFOXYA12_FULL_61_11]
MKGLFIIALTLFVTIGMAMADTLQAQTTGGAQGTTVSNCPDVTGTGASTVVTNPATGAASDSTVLPTEQPKRAADVGNVFGNP